MAIIGATQFLERMQFFNGERLFAADLQGIETFNREMRWLHNQSLHQVGVASGFAVSGNAGEREVTISPGYAIDCRGREIILTQMQVFQIPPVADNGSGGPVFYDLTVSYPEDSELRPSETRAGVCTEAGVVRLREEPVFCWVRLGDDPNRQPVDEILKQRIKAGLFLVLAQIEVFNCQLKQKVSTVQRRSARPPKPPHIGCGIETQSPWNGPTIFSDGTLFGARVYTRTIDTRSGGFTSLPSYVARLAGPRVIAGEEAVAFIDAFINITAPTTQGFRLEIFPAVFGSSDQTTIDAAVKQWQVAWLGIES